MGETRKRRRSEREQTPRSTKSRGQGKQHDAACRCLQCVLRWRSRERGEEAARRWLRCMWRGDERRGEVNKGNVEPGDATANRSRERKLQTAQKPTESGGGNANRPAGAEDRAERRTEGTRGEARTRGGKGWIARVCETTREGRGQGGDASRPRQDPGGKEWAREPERERESEGETIQQQLSHEARCKKRNECERERG